MRLFVCDPLSELEAPDQPAAAALEVATEAVGSDGPEVSGLSEDRDAAGGQGGKGGGEGGGGVGGGLPGVLADVDGVEAGEAEGELGLTPGLPGLGEGHLGPLGVASPSEADGATGGEVRGGEGGFDDLAELVGLRLGGEGRSGGGPNEASSGGGE